MVGRRAVARYMCKEEMISFSILLSPSKERRGGQTTLLHGWVRKTARASRWNCWFDDDFLWGEKDVRKGVRALHGGRSAPSSLD